MRRTIVITMALLLQGCAFQHDVQRIGVGYNNAVADLSNELTLLNIVRAENQQPLHYTSFSRLSGSLVFTGTGGFNAAIHDTGRTLTTTNESDLAGMSTTTKATATTETDTTNPVTTAKSTVANALVSGGHVYTPSVQAQVVTGPSFDMELLDTQAFYEGVLGEVPLTTIDTLLDQDYDPELLQALLVERIDFTSLGTGPTKTPEDERFKNPALFPKGTLLQTLVNRPEDEQGPLLMGHLCGIQVVSKAADPKHLMPLSKIMAADGASRLTLKDLAALDGKALDLDKEINTDEDITNAKVIRPSDKRVVQLRVSRCTDLIVTPQGYPHGTVVLSKVIEDLIGDDQDANRYLTAPNPALIVARKYPNPQLYDSFEAAADRTESNPTDKTQKQPALVGKANVRFIGKNGEIIDWPTAVTITLRSPEGVIRYLGDYLRAQRTANANGTEGPYKVRGLPVFSVTEGRTDLPRLVSADLGGQRYSIVRPSGQDANARLARNMQVLSLVEELINLQKTGTDRPATVPVQVVQ